MELSPTLAQAGEARIIAEITKAAPSSHNGDDAAVLDPASPNHRTVVATDMMVEGHHFKLEWSTPPEVGEKAIMRNFADVEAMGARPTAALLAIAAPPTTPLSVVQGIAQGVSARCSLYNAELVGGDVTAANQLVITVTALGTLGGNLPALRLTGARAGQQVVAHGTIGWAAAGLALLQRYGRNLPAELAHLDPLIAAQCAPQLQPGRGLVARATGATSMTDNSDGLVRDLGTIAQRSGVQIALDAAALAPDELLVAAGAALDIDPWEWILSGGEDHTLVGTTSFEVPSGFRVIGAVNATVGTAAPGVSLAGELIENPAGWESF